MELSLVFIVIQLIFLESILSIDNAAVLGAMAAPLPKDKPIPWPTMLQGIEAPTHRLFGNQREAALKVGLLGAYLGRFLMLLAAAFIIRNPWLRLLGAIYLIYLATEHIAHLDPSSAKEEHEASEHKQRSPIRQAGFWSTVLAIELADLAFSLDNVVAAITLSDHLWIIMLGVGLGILAMRFAATIFSRLILWEPALQTGAYLLVLSLGVELLLKELLDVHVGELAQFVISVGILVFTVLIARSSLRNLHMLWEMLIILFRAIYAPFGLISWLMHLFASSLRRKPIDVEAH